MILTTPFDQFEEWPEEEQRKTLIFQIAFPQISSFIAHLHWKTRERLKNEIISVEYCRMSGGPTELEELKALAYKCAERHHEDMPARPRPRRSRLQLTYNQYDERPRSEQRRIFEFQMAFPNVANEIGVYQDRRALLDEIANSVVLILFNDEQEGYGHPLPGNAHT